MSPASLKMNGTARAADLYVMPMMVCTIDFLLRTGHSGKGFGNDNEGRPDAKEKWIRANWQYMVLAISFLFLSVWYQRMSDLWSVLNVTSPASTTLKNLVNICGLRPVSVALRVSLLNDEWERLWAGKPLAA